MQYLKKNRLSASSFVEGVLAGDKVVLSQAITLIESKLASDQDLAMTVLDQILPHAGQSTRVGITGVPGVGKSTFIEVLGRHLLSEGHKLAVLAIDPSSQRTKGSILGDKTRMDWLSKQAGAFIRPSPTGLSLGGVSHHTREAILLCEAAGFDVILVETVGVGQSETVVHDMVDFFLLLMLAGAGDELQGIKKGIVEMADLIAITKADGSNEQSAAEAKVSYQNALHLLTPQALWQAPVVTCSAVEDRGIDHIWKVVQEHQQQTAEHKKSRRSQQRLVWLQDCIKLQLDRFIDHHPQLKDHLRAMEGKVAEGSLLPARAAQDLLNEILKK